MRVKTLQSIADVSAEQWNPLIGSDDPFIEHAFLSLLESSGTVGARTGWAPRHVTLWQGSRLCAATPAYGKEHSYGEYIFDWPWARAALRAGIAYYPKTVAMVPCTPASGRRVLRTTDLDRDHATRALAQGLRLPAEQGEASSSHWLFLGPDEAQAVAQLHEEGWIYRKTFQFHWHNEGYESFEDFLNTFRSSQRKQVRRERREVAELGLRIRWLEGASLSPEAWAQIDGLYRKTCSEWGSYPYLTPAFFTGLAGAAGQHARVVVAERQEEIVAAALFFHKGKAMFGRYWGSRMEAPFLHFELCYYQPIDWAIRHGVERLEAGAQGIQKLRRGFRPQAIHSAHWIAHEALREAVRAAVAEESRRCETEMQALAHHGPFKRCGA